MKIDYDFDYLEMQVCFKGHQMTLSFDNLNEMLCYSVSDIYDDVINAIAKDLI